MLKIKSNSVTFLMVKLMLISHFYGFVIIVNVTSAESLKPRKTVLLHSVPIDIAPKAVNKINDNLIIQWLISMNQ